MTREVIAKIREQFPNIMYCIEHLRRDYKNDSLNKDAVIIESYGYTKGLHDAGLITELERQVLFIYTTV